MTNRDKFTLSIIVFVIGLLGLAVIDGQNRVKKLTESNNQLKLELVQLDRHARFLESQNRMLMEEVK